MAEKLTDGVRIQHRGRDFTLDAIDPNAWKLTDATGRNYGTLVIVAAEGEGGEPVYGGVLPAATATELEGSDWETIAIGLINDVDAD